MILQGLTRATHDSTSSGPIPAPRTRPRRRKPTTAAQMTHSTAIAMSESRACLVMAMYSAPAMMDSARRWRRGVRGLMRDWGQRSSHGEREINITLKLESSHGQCYYGSNVHCGIVSPIQGLRKCAWRSRVIVCPGSPDPNQQWTVLRARVGHVSSVKCEVLESAKRKAIIRSYPRECAGLHLYPGRSTRILTSLARWSQRSNVHRVLSGRCLAWIGLSGLQIAI